MFWSRRSRSPAVLPSYSRSLLDSPADEARRKGSETALLPPAVLTTPRRASPLRRRLASLVISINVVFLVYIALRAPPISANKVIEWTSELESWTGDLRTWQARVDDAWAYSGSLLAKDSPVESEVETEVIKAESARGFRLPSTTATCSRAAEINTIREAWGDQALEMGEAYLGSGERTRAFLRKLQRGEPIKLAILGGSVTVGHSLDVKAGEITWGNILFNWINATFPHPEHSWKNGAVPATGTDYFAACYDQHVPNDSDLFVMEAAINDKYVDELANEGVVTDAVDYTETLTREILAEDDETAMIMLSAWAVPHPYINGAEKHNIVAEYYDVPRLSSRAFLYKYYLQHMDELAGHYNQADFGHQSQEGHLYMAQLIIWYLEKMLCQMEVEETHPRVLQGSRFQSEYAPNTLPAVRLKQRLRAKPVSESKAFCASSNIKKADGAWGLMPSVNEGWSQLQMYGKSWWTADDAGSVITFPGIEVHGGSVGIYYYRSKSMALGNLFCWVDGDKAHGQKLTGPWGYASVGSYGHVKSHVPEGIHSLSCEVMQETDAPGGEHHVRIIAVMAS